MVRCCESMAVGCGVLRKGPKLKHWEGLRMRGNRGVFYTFAPAPHHRGNKLDDKMATILKDMMM